MIQCLTGEQVSSGLLAIALQAIGLNGKSLSGWQIPIITDQYFSKASINEIKTEKFKMKYKRVIYLLLQDFKV